jgi:MFS family permease
MKEKLKFYRPAAAAFLVIMAMALTSSTMSFFLEPICEDLQISRGSFSAIFSLMSISGALSNPFLGHYAGKKGVRGILLLMGLWSGICMVLLSVVTKLWMLYAVTFCLGLLGSTCLTLCGTVMVQQSYSGAQASGILGAVMAGSGVGGVFFSLMIPGIMENFGWRMAMRAMGISWLVLLWLGMLLLGKQDLHQDSGLKDSAEQGMTRGEALKSPKLYLQMGVIVVMGACCGLQQQLPSLLGAQGFSAGQVSVMISASTALLALGKFGQGLLYGKIGVKKGGLLTMAAFALGGLAMMSKALIWPGLMILAVGFGVYTTLLPLVARQVFGSREYPAIWALISTAGCAGVIVGYPLWGTIYDLTGTYTLGLIGAAVLLICAMWAHCKTLKDIPS